MEMNHTHLTDYDKNFNRVELFSNEDESWIQVNGTDVWQSDATGHDFTGRALFQNCRDLVANYNRAAS